MMPVKRRRLLQEPVTATMVLIALTLKNTHR
jgi:hypothetical protein